MKDISIYIHIPFCAQKCRYCDFPSYAGKDKLIDEYIKSLNMEILKKASEYKIKSIYIGGGTPTYLNDKNLERLLYTINKLKIENEYEFTVECNPGTLTVNKLKILKKYKVNRLSLGLQSTDNRILKEIGRIHTYEKFLESYFLARNLGFSNINIDIMFNLPDQSFSDFDDTLNKITSLNPEHISCYSLIIEEKTPFYKLYSEGKLNISSEEDEINMYHNAKKILEQSGYNQYEISNYAKASKECIHNEAYWKCNEYLGLGVSASSFINDTRFKNIDDIDTYIKRIQNDEDASDCKYKNTINDDMEEFMFMGLRMIEGISEDEFFRKFNKKIDDVYSSVLIKHISEGLLARNNGRIYLSKKGIEVSNYVMSDFIL
ncbi:radical SAM family heme chaperone HemW [Clostridium sp. BJN0001]|uniref:radical SAM family heme chaperone HemW n=1 Tax=Clostridium sp. BJN0001 TaxID=2930219 RepID=UPI001FD3CFC1|nr:radical SAM family heme chaperone HemW [Clostridium sp. BJN0001]